MPMSGEAMLKLYKKNGWVQVSQRGSHVKVRKDHRIEIIPLHKELKKGLEAKLLKRLKENG